MKTLKRYLPQLIALTVIAALAVGFLLLLPEKEKSDPTSDLPSETSESSGEADASDVSETSGEDVPAARAYLNGLPRYKNGYESSLSAENAGTVVTLEATFGGSTGVNEEFSLVDRTVKVPERRNGEDGGYTTVEVEQTEQAPQLELYGGILLQNKEKGVFAIGTDGAILLDLTGYEPAYMRSPNEGNAPLFRKNGQYYFLKDNLPVATTSVRNLGVYFDYNSAYYAPKLPYYPFKDAATGFYGYKKGAEIVIDPNVDKVNGSGDSLKYRYYKAFFFDSYGFAAVQSKQNGRVVFIDGTGRIVIDPDLFSYGYTEGTKALDLFLLPDTFGKESIGFLYFDHGFIRVRRQVVDRTNFTSILEDYDTLIGADGNYSPLPGGYTLVGYMDGVALLQKGDRYGFFKPGESWITEPSYTVASTFSGGLGVIGDADGKVGAIDVGGKFVIPQVFDYISPVSEDRMVAYSDEAGWVLLRLGVKTDG